MLDINWDELEPLGPIDPTPEELAMAARIAECPGHEWLLNIDMGAVSLDCTNCPADVNELFFDGHEFICGSIPVTVKIETEFLRTMESYEEDYWIEVYPRSIDG